MEKSVLELSGADGNAFMILGLAKRSAKAGKMPAEQWQEFQAKAMSGDYDNLLATCFEYFEVV